MKKELTMDQVKIEMSADKDVRKFIEALQEWFDLQKSNGEITNKEICERAAVDASFLSRTINGKNGNPNLKTIAKLFRSMNLRLSPVVQDLSNVLHSGQNCLGSQAYDDAKVEVEFLRIFITNIKKDENTDRPVRQTQGHWDGGKIQTVFPTGRMRVGTVSASNAG